MDPSDRYTFREPTERDFGAVVAVLLAEQRADEVEPTIDAHFLRQVWSRPGFDLAADAWVATDGAGTVVAYGQVGRGDGDVIGSWGVVHPEHRGRGIGSALLDRIEARATTMLAGITSPRFRQSIYAADRGRRGDALGPRLSTDPPFLAHADRHRWTGRARTGARRNLDRGHRATRRPPGGPRDRRAAFADDPGENTGPFDQWAAELTTGPAYDPTLWLLARDQGVPVGALTASAGDDVGWVDYLAVLDSHRGRGVGSALLRRAFATFADRGLARVRLNVDAENVTGATAVYERVGMRVVNRWDLWERQG